MATPVVTGGNAKEVLIIQVSRVTLEMTHLLITGSRENILNSYSARNKTEEDKQWPGPAVLLFHPLRNVHFKPSKLNFVQYMHASVHPWCISMPFENSTGMADPTLNRGTIHIAKYKCHTVSKTELDMMEIFGIITLNLVQQLTSYETKTSPSRFYEIHLF